jgi:DNA-binding MarR family transcriptional regulator/GNAT superfamily N-acetyltransferase
MTANPRIDSVRRFTRFYTKKIGVLDQRLLRSPFSLSEGRVLYELSHHKDLTAKSVGETLGIDTGYLSRMLADFTRRGLVTRKRSQTDRRERQLSLTSTGRKAFAALDHRSNAQMGEMLAALTVVRQQRLVDAMRTVEELLASPESESSAKRPVLILRAHRPGDMGWITHRQAVLYHREYGWNEEYEALIAGIMSRFISNFDPVCEHCWIAEREGEIVGSVFVVRKTAATAQLRLLYVEPSARGLGIGARLVDESVRFARKRNYRKMMLWTNSVLTSARRLYEAKGFHLVKEEQHHSFGMDLTGQNWELKFRR